MISWLLLALVLAIGMAQWARHFDVPVPNSSALGGLRFLSVLLLQFAWAYGVVALAAKLGGVSWETARRVGWYGPLVPLFILATADHEYTGVRAFLFRCFYDIPMFIAVIGYSSVGWKLNQLYTYVPALGCHILLTDGLTRTCTATRVNFAVPSPRTCRWGLCRSRTMSQP